jgi:hypothetical protein
MTPLLLSLVLACQDPSPPVAQLPAASPARDVIHLKNGDAIEGRITTQLDGYLEVELEAGATIGIATTQIASIKRGAGAAIPAATIGRRTEWFVLHDASGQAVGWLSVVVTPRADGGFSANEEYEFQNGARRYQVTTLAIADAGGVPASCYFRERVTEPAQGTLSLASADRAGLQERIVDERIVEARVRGERLFVTRLDKNGRNERDLAWFAGNTFPLLLRTMVRANATVTGLRTLFDPATEELVQRSYDGSRRRSVVLEGKVVHVTEVAETSTTGRNAEWVDASARTLRRELAGPALVAVPSSAASARLAVGATTIPSAIAAEAGGTFGLWVPNPAWQVRSPMPAGQVVLACEAHGASVSLSRLDHLEPGTPLPVAVDAVANWFRLLQPELVVDAREETTVRERPAVRLAAKGRSQSIDTIATLDVIDHNGRFLVLTCVAPARAWDELAIDFIFLRRTVELDARALQPELQGPIAQRERRAQAKAGRHAGPQDVVRPPAPAAESKAKPKAPLVRIPNGG